MSDSQAVPEWTLADRLRKARVHAGLEQSDLARALDVTPSAVSRWEKGAPIKRPFVSAWALRCGVPFEWLWNGTTNPPDQGTGQFAWLTVAEIIATKAA